MLDGNHKKIGNNFNFVIAIINTIVNIGKLNMSFFDQFNYVVYDEIHSYPTEFFSKAFLLTNIEYRIGITATLEREDGFHRGLNHFFEKIIDCE